MMWGRHELMKAWDFQVAVPNPFHGPFPVVQYKYKANIGVELTQIGIL